MNYVLWEKMMKFKNFIFFCIAAVLLFSCTKKKEQIEIVHNKPAAKAEIINDFTESPEEKEREEMKEFIYKNDEYFQEREAEIDFIEKANFGIPGGDNWIIRLNSRHVLIYVIKDGKIEEDYYGTETGQYFVDQYMDEISDYDILHDIPGTHMPGGSVSFGDFNGDGKDELFRYVYAKEIGHNIDLFHYEPQRKAFVICRIRFKIIDSKKGPAPVKFMNYKGKYGFKVFYSNIEPTDGPKWIPDPDPKNDKWIFYSWDEKQRMFAEVGEVVD